MPRGDLKRYPPWPSQTQAAVFGETVREVIWLSRDVDSSELVMGTSFLDQTRTGEGSGDALVAPTILDALVLPRKQLQPDTVLTHSTVRSRRFTRNADRGGRFLLPVDAGGTRHRRRQPGSVARPAASRTVRRVG